MYVSDLYLSITIILFSHLISIQATQFLPNSTISNIRSIDNTTISGNSSIMATSIKNHIEQGKKIIHDAFVDMDRGTIIRGAIVLAGITCLVLLYIGIKSFL